MKVLVLSLAVVLASVCKAQDQPSVSHQAVTTTCLIVKHATTAHQVFVSGANWQYVAGDFPKGMKWKSNITDQNVRKIKELGGRVVVVPSAYSAEDLAEARKTCSDPSPD